MRKNFQNDEIINPIIKNIYTRIGFEEASEFNNYLKQFDISFDEVKKKIKIEEHNSLISFIIIFVRLYFTKKNIN